MKIKQTCEDFRVDELYNLESLKQKKNESQTGRLRFKYFILTKKDYTVNRAIEYICRSFKIQIKDVHFAGIKDRQAVTTQLISLRKVRDTWKEDAKYFNEKNPDLQLKFIGEFPSRLNLGDNLGNKFTIVVRDLDNKEIDILSKNLPKIKKRGVLNFFDSQRFGYSGKNHIVGKYLLSGNFEKAFFTIITSMPKDNSKEEHIKFINYLTKNWKPILENNNWSEALLLCPEWLRPERRLIEYVAKYKNDFLGAISLLPKKIRTLYINSYQSYLFNEAIKYLDSINKLEQYKELPLIASESELKDDWGKFVKSLLDKDELTLENFKMPSVPTLTPREVIRKIFITVNNLKISVPEEDSLNKEKKKIVVSFDLGPGSYATNVIKCLFDAFE